MRHMQQAMALPSWTMTMTMMSMERQAVEAGGRQVLWLNDGKQKMEARIRWAEMGDIHDYVPNEDKISGFEFVDDRFHHDWQWLDMRREELAQEEGNP